MARKKRASSKPNPAPPVLSPAGAVILPPEVLKGDWTAILFGLMMVFAPGMGVPHEEMRNLGQTTVLIFATARKPWSVPGFSFHHSSKQRDRLGGDAFAGTPRPATTQPFNYARDIAFSYQFFFMRAGARSVVNGSGIVRPV